MSSIMKFKVVTDAAPDQKDVAASKDDRASRRRLLVERVGLTPDFWERNRHLMYGEGEQSDAV